MKLYYNTKGYGASHNESICDVTKPIDLYTIKHIYPEFFL